MAENMSLLSLEDDLTCSICLCVFQNPVSLICGHSFCANCLEATWSDRTTSLFCPHCRMQFSSKPELKKNTVLGAVLDVFKVKAGLSDPVMEPVEVKSEKKDPEQIKCDSCMEAKAVKTCLTCMASYCGDHVRPHLENAVFRAHQLTEPLPDLLERLCPGHSKLMEFFCTQHQCCICSTCLQCEHKGCDFTSTDDQRVKQKTGLMDKLNTLDVKIDKNQQVIMQMKEQQEKLKNLAVTRKRILETEYRQIREMIDRDEKEALHVIDKEQESGQSKLASLIKKFNNNIEKMDYTRSEINNLLDQSHSLTFLKTSVDLPAVVNFEPYNPRVNVDSKGVIAHHSSAVALKEWMTKLLEKPVENRIPILKPEFKEMVFTTGIKDFTAPPNYKEKRNKDFTAPPNYKEKPFMSSAQHSRSRSPGAPLRAKAPGAKQKNRSKQEKRDHKEHRDQSLEIGPNFAADKFPVVPPLTNYFIRSDPKCGPAFAAVQSPGVPSVVGNYFDRNDLLKSGSAFAAVQSPDVPSVVANCMKRNDLLKYGTILSFDVKTAHRRILLSENNTKATVTDESTHYPDIFTRFSDCSQVLCTKGFSQGRHYWEIKMSSNSFCGLGLAYGKIARKGPSSRLGRNAESWCVEWFNVRLSAWHNSIETVLENPNPGRVGILLDCDEGSATFYNVRDQAYPFYTFVFPFSEPVYPAFWIFSNGSNISLCKLST